MHFCAGLGSNLGSKSAYQVRENAGQLLGHQIPVSVHLMPIYPECIHTLGVPNQLLYHALWKALAYAHESVPKFIGGYIIDSVVLAVKLPVMAILFLGVYVENISYLRTATADAV